MRPYAAAALPVGTVIVYDGMEVVKTHKSSSEPFPWIHSHDGSDYTCYGDEWATNAINDGAAVTKPKES